MTDLFHNLSDEAATTQNTKQIESSVTKETKSKGNNNQKGLVDSPQYIMDMFSASTNQNTHLHSKPKVKSGSNTLIATKKTNSKAKSTVESSSSTGVSVHSVPTSKSLVSFPSSYVSAVDQSSDTELIGEPRVARSNVCDASSSNRPHKSISFSQHPPQELLSQQQMLKSDTHHCQKGILHSLMKIELGNDNKSHSSSCVPYSGLTSPNSLVRSPSVSSALPSELCHKIQKPFERITDTVSQQHSEIEASTVSSSIPKESSQESPEVFSNTSTKVNLITTFGYHFISKPII